MRRIAFAFVAMAGMLAVASGRAAAGGQVDPAQMERAPRVEAAGPIDTRVVGAWDVWIPGSVYYLADGRRITQHYQPGAAMNRLEIGADGQYRWGDHSGRLEEVLPWHHQPGRRYFRVAHASGDEYEFYYGAGDKLVVLFGGVGGHAATGTRLGSAAAMPATGDATPPADATPSDFPPGARVAIEWSGGWYPGTILRADAGRYRVRYDGYGSHWDEWVTAARLRAE